MSVQNQLSRLRQNVENTYAELSALGAEMPGEQNSDNLAATASTINIGTLLAIVVNVESGATVVATMGDTSVSGTSDSSGTCVLTVPEAGQWSVVATLNGLTSNTQIVTVEDSYEASLSFFTATITVTVDSGSVVTCEKDGVAQTKTSTGTAVFTVTEAGTYSITAELDGQSVSDVVTISSNGQAASLTLSYIHIYGVQWDGTSTTTWSRTDAAETFVNPSPAVNNGSGSSPFDSCMPWSGMVKESDSTAGVLVKIPKYYYKWTRSGSTMKLQIADGPEDGFLVSPAHADRGDGSGERDYVYVGRYHCISGYKSTSGSQPLGSITRATARTNIHNLGSTYWQYDFAMYWTIMMLYLVEYADWNSQKVIGYGCSSGGAKFNTGATDAMSYHTGTSAASRTTYGSVQYRYIEGLWDNMYDWCDGIYFSGTTVYCIKNPASFSDTTGGTNVGTRASSSNYISGWTTPTASGFEYALYPNAGSGSESTYVCDYCSYNSGGVVLRCGGYYNQYQGHGLFYLNGSNAASGTNAYFGCRLQKLP